MLVPTLAHGMVIALRLSDRGFEEFDGRYKFFLAKFIILVILLFVAWFLLIDWKTGFIWVGTLVAILYATS